MEVNRAILIAEEAWDHPCNDDVNLYLASLKDTVVAETAQCNVWYDPEYLGLTKTNWSEFCTYLVHEWGHLAGEGHSSDPNDVMYPWPTHDGFIADACL